MARFPRWPAPLLLLGYVAVAFGLMVLFQFVQFVGRGSDPVQAGGLLLAFAVSPYGAWAAGLLACVGVLGFQLGRRLDPWQAGAWTFGAAWLACLLSLMAVEPHRLLHLGS